MDHVLKVGKKAPEFVAQAYHQGTMKKVSSADFPGKWICLFFYPLDFTFVCPTEINGFAEKEADFLKAGCQIIGCSTDSEYCHKAWFEKDLPNVKFPILADTTHAVSRAYQVLEEDKGVSLRGTFIIDPQGILHWMSVNSLNVGRSVEEVLRTLQALQTGGLCPVDWKVGMKTLG